MIWVSLILGLVEALPSIIKVIQEIVALVHGHPLQATHEHAFLGILRAFKDSGDPIKAEQDLKDLRLKLAA